MLITLAAIFLVSIFSWQASCVETGEARFFEMGKRELSMIAADSSILKAVREQNKKNTLEKTKSIDELWLKGKVEKALLDTLMNNQCALVLKKFTKTFPYIVEAFVMDKYGANVCMLNKTSDYWQGDEAKFVKAYAAGKGGIFVDKVRFDVSTQIYSTQVSVPVLEDHEAIGAITFGIQLSDEK